MIRKFFFAALLLIASKGISQNWQPLGTGTSDYIIRLYSDTVDTFLYAVGDFKKAGNITVNKIARWNGVAWDSMGSGSVTSAAPVWPITRYNGNIYTSGAFINPSKSHIVKWNGTAWDSVAEAGGMACMYVDEATNILYGCGNVSDVNGITVYKIAQFDGTNWSPVGNVNWAGGSMGCMTKYNGELYVGGNMWQNNMIRIAKWDGANWSPVGNGIQGGAAWLTTMEVYNNELYAGGYFKKSDGNAGNNIQKWDGASWSDVGGGVGPGQIWQLKAHNGKLYAAGVFSQAGGVPAQSIAIWDGSDWCSLGSTIDNSANSIAFYKDTMHIAGGFWTIDGDSVHYVAKWIGGNYVDSCGNTTGINENYVTKEINIFPNPASGIFNLQSPNEITGIEIINVLGEKIYSLNESFSKKEIDLSGKPPGVYFIRAVTERGIYTGKIILQ